MHKQIPIFRTEVNPKPPHTKPLRDSRNLRDFRTHEEKINNKNNRSSAAKRTCLSWPRRFDKTTIWSLRVFQARASKQSCRMSVAAFLVPDTSPASLICFSTFSNCSIAASKFAYRKFSEEPSTKRIVEFRFRKEKLARTLAESLKEKNKCEAKLTVEVWE